MTVIEALEKIVGPGHGRAGRVTTTLGSTDYFPPAPTDERVWPFPPKQLIKRYCSTGETQYEEHRHLLLPDG